MKAFAKAVFAKSNDGNVGFTQICENESDYQEPEIITQSNTSSNLLLFTKKIHMRMIE